MSSNVKSGAAVSTGPDEPKSIPTTVPVPDHCVLYFDQNGASDYLWMQCGIKVAPTTLKKLRSVGGGPTFFRGYGRRIHYGATQLKEWGDTHRSMLVSSTSELLRKATMKRSPCRTGVVLHR